MDDEYTVTLPVKGKDANNYKREVIREMTFYIAFLDYNLVRPFTQADTNKFSDEDVTYSEVTYCLIRWKDNKGKVRHVTGCTWKHPKDKENYLEARKHAFSDALRVMFPGYFILNPARNNKQAVPHAVDGRVEHTANRETFWKWFREVVEPEIMHEKEWEKSPIDYFEDEIPRYVYPINDTLQREIVAQFSKMAVEATKHFLSTGKWVE